jgi:hypothetical protein
MSNTTTSAPSFVVTSKRPLASAVRAWGADQNANHGASLPGTDPKTRGRLNPVLVSAYNAKHKGANAYTEKDRGVKSITVKAKPAKGRTVEKRVSVPEARAALLAKGVTVGKRGRLPEAALAALILG